MSSFLFMSLVLNWMASIYVVGYTKFGIVLGKKGRLLYFFGLFVSSIVDLFIFGQEDIMTEEQKKILEESDSVFDAVVDMQMDWTPWRKTIWV